MKVFQAVPNTMLEHAIYYIEVLGLGLCSFESRTKGPNTPGWNSPGLYIDTVAKAIKSINERNNIGGIHTPSLTASIDVDHLDWCKTMFAEFGMDIESYISQGAQISSGRPNRCKALFKIPACLNGIAMFKINWPDPETGLPVCVIEFRLGDVQDVLPPSIHPDTDKPYFWVKAPWELGHVIPDMPHELVQLILHKDKFKQQLIDACPWTTSKPSIKAPPKEKQAGTQPSNDVITQFNAAHDVRSMLEQHGYERKGKRYLAPNSSTRIAGVILFEDDQHFYSHHGSDFFGDGKRHDAFDLFCHFDYADNVSNAVRAAAELLGIAPKPKQIEKIASTKADKKPAKSADKKVHVPNLAPIPGVLGECVKWINDTSPKPQPLFAVQAALAFGSVVAGRKYETNNRNWSSLYFLNIGKSASGKEHAKTVIEELLDSAGLDHLIGPGRYSSEAGLLSTLIDRPTCISVMDEFGKMLDSSNAQSNYMSRDAFKFLMEAWGRCHGVMRSTGYSTAALSEKQKEELNKRIVRNPALTILGMSTPDDFFKAIGSGQITDGFLNRLVIAHSDIGRQLSRPIDDRQAIPEVIKDWAKRTRERLPPDCGNIEAIEMHDMPPASITVNFTQDSKRHFREFEQYCLNRMDDLESQSLAELYGRTNEIAMRVALIVALSCDSKAITLMHSQWATNYVDELQKTNIDHMRGKMADSPFQALRNAVYAVICNGGSKGRTHRELGDYCRPYRASNPKLQDDVINALVRDDDIQLQEITSISNRGKKRIAWVAVEVDTAETDSDGEAL